MCIVAFQAQVVEPTHGFVTPVVVGQAELAELIPCYVLLNVDAPFSYIPNQDGGIRGCTSTATHAS